MTSRIAKNNGKSTGKVAAPGKSGPSNVSAQGNRKDAVGKNQNSKEAFLKKIQLCKRTFDYKDE